MGGIFSHEHSIPILQRRRPALDGEAENGRRSRPHQRQDHCGRGSPCPRVKVAEVERWRDDFISQGSEALRSHPRDLATQFEAREQQLLAKVGELTLAVDILKKAHRILGKDLPEGIS